MREENGEIVLLWLKARHKLKAGGYVDMEIKHEHKAVNGSASGFITFEELGTGVHHR